MKASVLISVFVLGFVSCSLAQKRADIDCPTVEKILEYAKTDFKELLGELEMQVQDCNYYYSKVSFGIDSTSTLQSCKDHKGHLILHFDIFIGNDEIQSDLEFKNLEETLDRCLPGAKITEIKPGDFKRVVEYKLSTIRLSLYQDKVKNALNMTPLVTISVVKTK